MENVTNIIKECAGLQDDIVVTRKKLAELLKKERALREELYGSSSGNSEAAKKPRTPKTPKKAAGSQSMDMNESSCVRVAPIDGDVNMGPTPVKPAPKTKAPTKPDPKTLRFD